MKNLTFVLLFIAFLAQAQTASYPKILSERERAEVIDNMLTYRFDNLLPHLMRREGIDM